MFIPINNSQCINSEKPFFLTGESGPQVKSLAYIGFPHHFISSDGRLFTRNIRGSKRLSDRLIEMRYSKARGYKGCVIRHCGNVKARTIHRFVAEAFLPFDKNRQQVNHKNGDKSDARVENLEWCTPKENVQHANDNNLITRHTGVKNHAAKLDPCKVSTMRLLYSMGHSRAELRYLFKVGQTTVRSVVVGDAWPGIEAGRI